MNLKNYFQELKRRNVFKAALAYLVVAWIIVQVASIVFPAFKASPEVLRSIILILIIGFPVWLVFAWVYEMTPDGLKKTKKIDPQNSITSETSQKFNKIILGALAIAIVLLGANLYSNYSATQSVESHSDSTVTQGVHASSEKDEKSVAVLAFADMSPNKDQEYFADGISEEILNLLAKNPDLKVMSRTSSFYFKDKEATIEEIGNKLEVNYLLEGSIRKAGEMIRITVQLINISDGSHIWSETFDRKLKDIFKIQDEIAESVTRKLEVSILGENTIVIDPKAYTLYLKAKHLYKQFKQDSEDKALELVKEATSIDPNFAPAWGLISEIYIMKGFGILDLGKEDAYELGLNAARRAIEVDPEYAKGYMLLARLAVTQFDFEKAKINAEKALGLAPENAEILRRKGLMTFDSIEESIQDNLRALKMDPLLYVIHYNLGLLYYWKGENQEALRHLKIYEEYQPGSSVTSSFKSMILLELGRTAEAEKELQKESDLFFRSYANIMVQYRFGKENKTKNLLDDFIKKNPDEATNIADLYAFMGNREKAFEWLRRALEIKDPTLGEGIFYPSFRKFHKDPRWQQLLKDMGVPEENGIPGYKG